MPLQVLSSFEDRPGTMIVGDEQLKSGREGQAYGTQRHHRHRPRKERGDGHSDRPSRHAGHGRRHLRAAGRGRDQRRHDRPERSAARARRAISPSPCPAASLAHSVAALEAVRDRIGFVEIVTNTDVVKVSAVGVGMRSNAGHRRPDVRDARRSRHQHPRHHHLGDQGLGADPRGIYRARRARPPHRLRARRQGDAA